MADGEPFGEGLVIRKATDDDFQDILDFICEDFMINEPLTDALNGKRHEMEQLFIDLVKQGLSEPHLTYLVRSTNSNKVAALRLTGVLDRPHEPEELPHYESYTADVIAKLLSTLEHKTWDILPPNVSRLATWIIISVGKDFTRRGIAQKLVEYKLDEIKRAGCSGIVTEATASNSQKLFSKLGYTVLYEILHSDWKDKNDQVIFKCNDSTDRAQLNYISL
ncbi:hypothetical protein FO519_008373 [Halicephalobus sp. NKZ332]|nr:hypothetical protein FO519_008373 [Halicephalobus sp. NKZ332]